MISRLLDLTLGLTGSIITAPVVAVLALAVRLESPGDPIYRQKRVGKDGRPFEIYKLRTMVSGAEFRGAGLAIAEGDDTDHPDRRAAAALLARRAAEPLERGPRRDGDRRAAADARESGARLHAAPARPARGPPGITGWAQVNGRASLPWPERIELDLWYVEHRSLALDLTILRRTVDMVVRGHGIYKGATGGWQGPTSET